MLDKTDIMWYNGSVNMEKYSSGRRGVTRNLVGRESVAWVQIPPSPPTKKEPLSTKTKVLFLNDVCLRQMMTATPNDVRCANDAWLRHILVQTSHHCGTQWSNIIFAKQMHHIAAGDASLKIQGFALDLFVKV